MQVNFSKLVLGQSFVLDMGWGSPKAVLGCIAFLVFWVMAVFPAVPILPIGRTAGSLLGACLMVVFDVLSPNEAFAAVDLPILGLLFGTMVVSVYLERADMFKYIESALSWKSLGAKDLICRVSFLSAISSALITNDTTCVVFTSFILKLCRENKLPPQPFLIALASSANIGSASTPIGNPQNLVIAVQSNISFGKFLAGIIPAMLVGIIVNTLLILLYYWKRLVPIDPKPDQEEHDQALELQEVCDLHEEQPDQPELSEQPGRGVTSMEGKEEIQPSRPSIIEINDLLRLERRSSVERETPILEATSLLQRWKTQIWKMCVYLVMVGMLVAFLYGLDLSWTAVTAAVVLMMLDFTDAGPCLDQVSYSLLVFFSGMFISVRGFNKTGAPGQLWNSVEPHARINTAAGIAILSAVIILLSNVASNVPTVLLLGSRVASSAAATHGASLTKAWLILAWVSTVAGNLTLVGSAANIIVSEQARRAQNILPYNLSFWNHLRFGLPSTFIVIAAGLPLLQG